MTVNELIENYIPLADKIASCRRRSLPRCVQLDELKSAAYFGLVDAAHKYRQSRSDNFPAYAGIRISGAIQDYLRELGWGTRKQPRQASALPECGLPARPERRNELMAKVGRELPRQGRRVIQSYFMEDKTQDEIGQEVGLSKARICQILGDSCDRIRSSWGDRQAELWDEVA